MHVFAFMYVCVFILMVARDGIGSTGMTVPKGGELPCGCWDLNLVPLQEHLVILTTEPSLQIPFLNS